MGRRPIPVDAAHLEQLARSQPTQLAIALELGMSQKTLCDRLFTHPDLRRAYERGRSERAAAGEGRKPFAHTTREREAAPPPEPAVEKLRFTGTPTERVLAALEQGGGRTYGELMNETGLDWHQLVETVNRLMIRRRVVAVEVGGKRRHFLDGSVPVAPAVYEDHDDADAMEANY